MHTTHGRRWKARSKFNWFGGSLNAQLCPFKVGMSEFRVVQKDPFSFFFPSLTDFRKRKNKNEVSNFFKKTDQPYFCYQAVSWKAFQRNNVTNCSIGEVSYHTANMAMTDWRCTNRRRRRRPAVHSLRDRPFFVFPNLAEKNEQQMTPTSMQSCMINSNRKHPLFSN